MKSMLSKLLLFILLLSVGCSSGILPCPKIKTVKMRKANPNKRFALPTEALSASANDEKPAIKRSHSGDQKVVQNVSVEEWDCPKPGKKKYMPRKVKHNIRRNLERVNAPVKDSVSFDAGNR
jgi:hypothetical protein